jgi:drug/metabolite transporter (DMT)-like permease
MLLGGSALAVTLASSLGWAGFDVVRKLAVERVDARVLLAAMSMGQIPVFLTWALLGAPVALDAGYVLPGMAAVVLNAAASLLYLESVRRSPLSTTIPLLGLTPALSALAGALLVGELPPTRSAFGIALVVIGAFSLHARADDLARPWRIVGSIARDRGSAYMAIVAVLWSLSPVVDKLALGHASVVVHAGVQVGGVGLVMLGSLAWGGGLARLRTVLAHPVVVTGAAIVGAFALATQLYALRLVMVSVFEAVKRGIGMSLSVLSGRVWFGEPVTAKKLCAVGAMGAGVALLA